MPRSKRPSVASFKTGSFEPIRKNPISLLDDDFLDRHAKVIKIGEDNSPLSLSKTEFRIEGDLFLSGNLLSHTIKTENEYLDFISGTYFRFYNDTTTSGNEYKLYFAGGSALHVAAGDFIGFDSGAGDFNFTDDAAECFKIDGANRALYLYDDADVSDYFAVTVTDNGVAEIKTNDNDGTVGHLTIVPNGDLILDPASQKTIINATDALYFDGGGDTYISETSADVLSFVVGGQTFLTMTESTTDIATVGVGFHVPALKRIGFDGGLTGTYITESADDVMDIAVGGDIIMQLSEKGDDGNEVSFGSSCAGFTQLEPTYDATDTEVDFRHSNKQFLTFGSGNITNLKLTFPLVSGNFVLLIKQDGTGSRTITNWKVFEFDETAADGSNAVKFAGGSNPTLTTDVNHVDIISFYWDADNEIAYGVATLDFQF